MLKNLWGGGKTLSYLLAGVFAFATGGAWAANAFFTGKENNYFNLAGNWDIGRLPTSDTIFFQGDKFDSRFTENEVVFDTAYTISKQFSVRAVGTADNPLVWRATNADYGLKSTANNSLVGWNAGDAYLLISNGTWQVYIFEIGKNNKGWLYLKDINKFTVSQNLYLTKSSTLTLDGGSIFVDKGELQINGESVLNLISGSITLNNGKNLKLGGEKNKSASYIQKSGTLECADIYLGNNANSTSGEQYFELGGGTVTAGAIVHGDGNAPAKIKFDGGTLKARIVYDAGLLRHHDKVTHAVGNNGGTIDSNNLAINIGASINNEVGEVGAMTFKGGNKITLNNAVYYSGQTAVAPGTVLAVANEIAKNNILANGLVVAGVPTAGQTVMTYTDDLTGSDLSNVSCPLAPTTTFKIGDDGKSVIVDTVGPTLDNYWTGLANDGDLSNADNWKSGVPTSGNANIFSEKPVTLMKGETFAPTSITFLGGSAAVTINGEFSGIAQISNNSPSMVEFKDAVAFSSDVDVVQNSGAIKFTGGATGVKLVRATDIHGTYTFSETGDLTEKVNTTVKSDGVYNLPGGTFYKHNGDFHVEVGGKAVVKNAKIKANAACKLLGMLNGEFKVVNEFLVDGNSRWTTHTVCNSGSGTLVANKIRIVNNAEMVPPLKTIMGSDGIVRVSGYVLLEGSSYEFGSYGDWTMCYDTKGNYTTTASPVFYKRNNDASQLTFDTSDYYDNAIGRTITCEAPIGAKYVDQAEKIAVTVKGKGKFVFANTSSGNIFSGGLTVQDTATVEVKPNAWPGKGAITLGTGTTLALTATSHEFTQLANTLKLPTGENEKAIVRIDGKRLKSGPHVVAIVASGTADNVVFDTASAALDGRKLSWDIEDSGNLVLNIQSSGTMIIVR